LWPSTTNALSKANSSTSGAFFDRRSFNEDGSEDGLDKAYKLAKKLIRINQVKYDQISS
jgi:hypothetical protein